MVAVDESQLLLWKRVHEVEEEEEKQNPPCVVPSKVRACKASRPKTGLRLQARTRVDVKMFP